MAKSKRSAADPLPGLSASASDLWHSIIDEWELDEHELSLLRELVRVVSRLDALDDIVAADGLMVTSPGGVMKAHPALVEARQLAIAQARLTAVLRLPDGEEGSESPTRRQRRSGARGIYRVRAR